MFHLVLAPVPLRHEPRQELGHLDLLPRSDELRCGVVERPEPLEQRAHRRDDDAGRRERPAPPRASACKRARRRPMVSTSGLTRSKGRVSHAGRTETAPSSAPAVPSLLSASSRQPKSSASRSASSPVAVTTRMGRRSLKAAADATTTACAASGTASVTSAAPIKAATAGSARSRRGTAARLATVGSPARGAGCGLAVVTSGGQRVAPEHGGVHAFRRDALHRIRRGRHRGLQELAHGP